MERGHVEGPTTKPQVEWIATVGWNSLEAFFPSHTDCHQRRPSKEPLEAYMGGKKIPPRMRKNKTDYKIIIQE